MSWEEGPPDPLQACLGSRSGSGPASAPCVRLPGSQHVGAGALPAVPPPRSSPSSARPGQSRALLSWATWVGVASHCSREPRSRRKTGCSRSLGEQLYLWVWESLVGAKVLSALPCFLPPGFRKAGVLVTRGSYRSR